MITPRLGGPGNPEQESLFVMNQQTGMLHPNTSVLGEHAPSTVSPNEIGGETSLPGPHVNILERNAHLQNMLRDLGVVSRTAGLQYISDTSQRRKLEAQYDNVDSVVGAATNKSSLKQQEAKRSFAKAFGLEAMIHSDLTTEADAKAIAAATYSHEVLPVVADAKNAGKREVVRQWLNYQERTMTGQRTRKPSRPLPKPPKVV